MERKLSCVARYGLITTKFKVPSSGALMPAAYDQIYSSEVATASGHNLRSDGARGRAYRHSMIVFLARARE